MHEQLELCYQSIYIAEGNDAFAKMYEYEKAEELIGLTPNDFHDRNSQITRAAMQAWIENRYTCRSLETEEIDCHGRKRYFLNSAISTIENDCVTSTWISQVDITELRETQQALLQVEQDRVAELAKANEQLQQREHEVQRSYRLLSTVAQVTKDLLALFCHSGWRIMSAYLLVSLHSNSLYTKSNFQEDNKLSVVANKFSRHPWRDEGTGWNNLLNNLRLVLQTFVLFNLIRPWLKVFPVPALSLGFSRLISLMNYFHGAVPIPLQMHDFLFSAA